jgi:transcription elongation factor GreB
LSAASNGKGYEDHSRALTTVADRRGTEMTITIVGIDEADLDRGQVSWLSPVARR